jgi:hypothetical protein
VWFRVKCIRDNSSREAYWQMGFPWHVPTWYAIEWLDVDPKIRAYPGREYQDFTNEIAQALHSANVPFSHEGKYIRVWGYLRPGASPDFVLDGRVPQ